VIFRRPFQIAFIGLAVTLGAASGAPAPAHAVDLQDPILEPLPLPDVRQLPIVRDVPIVQSLPDVRELPVVSDVTAPLATPAPVATALPTVPAVPQPTSAPSLASGGGSGSGGGSTSGGGGGSSSGGGSTSGPESATRQAAPAGAGSTGEPDAAGTPRRVTGVRLRRRAGGKPPTPVERRDRRLRQTVRRLSGCLGVLDAGSRRVLVLRAGIGKRSALPRAAVAERLDDTVREVARTERRGVGELRAAARAGRCGGGPATATATAGAGPGTRGDAPGTATSAGRDGGGADQPVGAVAPTGRTGVKEEFRSSPPASPGTRVLRVAGDAPPVVLLLVLAFLGGFGIVWTLQRRGDRRGHLA